MLPHSGLHFDIPHHDMTKADNRPHLPESGTSLGHAPFVQPSTYLRPPMTSQSERPIDREERQGLVSLLFVLLDRPARLDCHLFKI